MKSFLKNMVIKSVKPNVPKTKIQKAIRDLKISTQKSKAGTAKLNQTIFELKNNKPFTFKKNKKKSESNTESYKRITGENNKVIKGMLDKATEKKAMGGRIGLKHGSYENVPPSKGFSEYVTKEKQKKLMKQIKKPMKKINLVEPDLWEEHHPLLKKIHLLQLNQLL